MSSSSPKPTDVVIVSAFRTPLCRSRKGALAKVPPSTLVETVLKASLDRTGIPGPEIEDVCMGNCLMPPSGFAAVRMAQMVAGKKPDVALPIFTSPLPSHGILTPFRRLGQRAMYLWYYFNDEIL